MAEERLVMRLARKGLCKIGKKNRLQKETGYFMNSNTLFFIVYMSYKQHSYLLRKKINLSFLN